MPCFHLFSWVLRVELGDDEVDGRVRQALESLGEEGLLGVYFECSKLLNEDVNALNDEA